MAATISLEIYQLLEEKIGKEEAQKVAKAIEIGFQTIEQRAEAVALQKKLELRDELSKELATKTDLSLVESRLDGRIEKLNLKLNFLIVLMIIALTLMNPIVADVIKSWLIK